MSITASGAQSTETLVGAVAAPVRRLANWLTSVHHATIGASLLVGAAVWLLVASAVGAVLGVDRLDAGSATVSADALTQLFSLHR